ncbi:hypothetical protein N431DRAFT_362000, partial [Stipitochalara longipes BDJ]
MAQPTPPSFIAKKQKILEQLLVPAEQYNDLSPKGSVDEGIRDLIDEINALEGCVTTSSCAGRISVFLEGKKKIESDEMKNEIEGGEIMKMNSKGAGVGGKGGGGRWLFVSHDPVDIQKRARSWKDLFGIQNEDLEGKELLSLGAARDVRFVHFKFEPMILHVLTASLQQAQNVLSAALQAGFRESGALNLISSNSEPATPMVGVRSMGLALETVIGFESGGQEFCIVPEYQLRNLVEVSNDRFKENTKRIERFRSLLRETRSERPEKRSKSGGEWEDTQVRRERKKVEGLKKAQMMKQSANQDTTVFEEIPGVGFLEQNT